MERSEADALTDLALQHYERREFAAAEETLDRLVTIAPARVDLTTYRLLAKLKGPDSARAVMLGALQANPGRTEFVAAYADTLAPEDAIAALAQHLADVRTDPSRAAYLLLRITSIRAPLARCAQGLPRDHGLSWRDTYRWPDAAALPALKSALQAELAMGSKRATARLDLAYIAVADGDWETAEKYLAELRNGPKRTPADFTAFGTTFHAGLDAMTDADIVLGLAPVHRLLEGRAADEKLFMASDQAYFLTFTLPFLRQLETMQTPVAVHVHLLDGADAEWREARGHLESFGHAAITLTAEASGAAAQGRAYARNYYHAVRYVRFHEELRRARTPIWMLDCDVQLLRDPRPLFASLKDFDLALRTNPCSFEPMLKITASCVGVAPTERGLGFARRVAASIIHWKNCGTWNWGVDQIALFSAYADMSARGREPKTLFLDNSAMNDKAGDTGAIRFMSGMDKFTAR